MEANVGDEKLIAIYQRLLAHCGPAPLLHAPWQQLPEPPGVIGPVGNREAFIAEFSNFADDDLEAAGILRRNENGTPQFAAELYDAEFVGLVLGDADGRPLGIITASGALA